MPNVGETFEPAISWLFENPFTVVGWIIALVAFVVVPFRRPAAEARSWLLVFLAVPWVALVIYWMIGRPQYAAQRQERFKRIPQMLSHAQELSGLSNKDCSSRLGEDNAAISNLSRGIGHFGALADNQAELIGDYDTVYDRMVEDIDSAQYHAHLELYIFADDSAGERIMASLQRASARGVKCRVLIDALGSFGSIRKIKRRLKSTGVEVVALLPLHRRWNSSRLDLRNHRKIVVIDGRIGYTGSQNIWDPSEHSRRANQEVMVRLRGPVVSQLQALFLIDWYLETQADLIDADLLPSLESSGEAALQVLATGPDFPHGGIDLIFARAMYNAAHEIVIVTPYFIPNDALLAAMKSAVIAGVRVRLITPRKSDHIMVGLAQRSYYSELLSVGVEIYRYGPDFLHAKQFRVDREVAVIGSSNMDLRSFELNAEIDLICYSDEMIAEVKALEEQYLQCAQRLDREVWGQRPLAIKVLENTARLLSDLI